MTAGLRWKRSTGDFVDSHCGLWHITPIYGGLTRPESYELRFGLKAERVVGSGQTQRECKTIAKDKDIEYKRQRSPITFIGERRSLTAIARGWHWASGRLAAKPLFEALRAIGVDPEAQTFLNLFLDRPLRHWQLDEVVLYRLRCKDRRVIVALGQRVSRELTKRGIDHVALVHPAARGRIRKRHRYIKHVRDTLGPILQEAPK